MSSRADRALRRSQESSRPRPLEKSSILGDLNFLTSRLDRPRRQSIRVRSASSTASRSVPGLSQGLVKKLYKARCRDLGISTAPVKEQKFLTACASYFGDRRFRLKDAGLGLSAAKVVAQMLEASPHFAYIDLSSNCLGDRGVLIIVRALLHNSAIVHLDISNNDLSPEGCADVLQLLANHPSLSSLSIHSAEGLRRNKLSLLGASALGQFFSENVLLSHLNLAHTSLGDRGLHTLLDGLANNSSLMYLNLSQNGITSIHKLCEVLPSTNIRELNLSLNRFGDEGCDSLSQYFLGQFDGYLMVTHLDLTRCEITVKGVAVLFEALRTNTVLHLLKLDGNQFPRGLSEVCVHFMKGNRALKHLSLSDCKLSHAGVAQLSEGLKRNRGLFTLNLSKNELTDEDAQNIADALKDNAALKQLSLAFNTIKVKPK